MSSLPSPRYSSLNVYSTLVGFSDQSAESTASEPPASSSTGELVEMSKTLANLRITEFMASLPTKSWVGKWIHDAVLDGMSSAVKLHNFVQGLWTDLIEAEGKERDILYQSLIPFSIRKDDRAIMLAFESCWEKSLQILRNASITVAERNPAYIRSETFTLPLFVKMTILESFSNRDLRMQWVRMRNLLKHTITQCDGGT